jgi:hypothetical protein
VSYVELSDLSAALGSLSGTQVATREVKETLTKISKDLVRQANNAPGNTSPTNAATLAALNASILNTQAQLNSFNPWADSSTDFSDSLNLIKSIATFGFAGGGEYAPSQIVRNNLGVALNVVRGKMGQEVTRIADTRPQGAPTNVWVDTAANMPGATNEVAKERMCQIVGWLGGPEDLCKRYANGDPSLGVWDLIPLWVKITGGLTVAGVGLFYFGGFIKAAGYLAERATKSNPGDDGFRDAIKSDVSRLSGDTCVRLLSNIQNYDNEDVDALREAVAQAVYTGDIDTGDLEDELS